MPGLGGSLEGRVRIRRRGLRERVAGLLSEALASMSGEDRRLILARLKQVVSRSSKTPPEAVSPAYVQELDDGGFEMVIEPRAFALYDDYRKQLAIIRHELDEIVRLAKVGESIHELEFGFMSDIPGGLEKCVLCGRELDEGYCINSLEEASEYLEGLSDKLGVDFEDFIICSECMAECCSPCKNYEICLCETPLDVYCRYPERWVERAERLARRQPKDKP
jgi:hypothetical protein